MKIITQSIQSSISLSYISALQDIYDMTIQPLYKTPEVLDDNVQTIINDLKLIFLSLDSSMDSDDDTKYEYVSKIMKYLGILEDRYRVINAYKREFGHISLVLEEDYQLKTNTLADVSNINYHEFTHDFLNFITSSKTAREKRYKLSNTLSFVPMRMTKDSFLNYIGHSLPKLSTGDTPEAWDKFIGFFKILFDGREASGYSEYFPDLYSSIENIRPMLDKDLSADQISEIFDDFDMLEEALDDYGEMLTILHSALSNLAPLFLPTGISFGSLMDMNIAFSDFFYTLKSLIQPIEDNEDYEYILETLPDRLYDVYSFLNSEHIELNDQLLAQLQSNNLQIDENSHGILQLDGIIKNYLAVEISDILAFHEAEDDSSVLPDSYIETCKAFLLDKFKEMPVRERKLRMQYLISVMPFIMNDTQLAMYFTNSIEGTSNEIKKAHVIARIAMFMESVGFFEEHSHDNHEHEHHHDCGCDHHH